MHGRGRSARYAALFRLPPFFAADLLALPFLAVDFFAAPFFAAEPRADDFEALDFFAALFFAAPPFAAVLRAPPFDADLLPPFEAPFFAAPPFLAALFAPPLLADLPALLLEPLLALLEPPFEAVFAEGISVLHYGVDRPHGPPVEREDALRASVTRRDACTASTRHVELKSRPFEARRDPMGPHLVGAGGCGGASSRPENVDR